MIWRLFFATVFFAGAAIFWALTTSYWALVFFVPLAGWYAVRTKTEWAGRRRKTAAPRWPHS